MGPNMFLLSTGIGDLDGDGGTPLSDRLGPCRLE